jgi:hypothetical protein
MFTWYFLVSTATVMNLQIWNPALANFGFLARDSSTCEYRRDDLPIQGMEDSPPSEGLPMDPSPKD